MSTADAGMEALLEAFIYETNTMLEQLDEILLESEKAKSISEENTNSIFRITHTIKGSAAMMNYDGISNLAHSVEDVFYIIREDPAKLDLVFDAIFDLVFQASDFFKQEIAKIQEGNYEAADPTEMISRLEEQARIMKGEILKASPARDEAGKAPRDQGAVPEEDSANAANGDAELFRIHVVFEDGCQMENMRAFMLMTQLKNYCDYLDSIPQHPEEDSGLSQEIIRNGFTVICKPRYSIEEVMKIVEASLNIKYYELLQEDSAPALAAGSQAGPRQAAAAVKADSAGAGAAVNSPIKSGTKQSLISVNQSKLDHLMDLVGEIVTAESMVVRNPDLKGLRLDNFTKSIRELRKLTDELQDIVMSIRLVPLQSTFQKMNRIVRDMSKKLDKKVELYTEGGDTEVDKTINDAIGDPFMHMIRNAVDHAIETPAERIALGKPETGRVTLSARSAGSDILIDIADDGCGLDPEKLLVKAKKNGLLTKPESEYTDKEAFQLIMLPGFSTNSEVTEFSGRGVGMDVVRKNVEKVGGTISISSVKNQGTTFTIKIPLTLAIMDGMNISVGDTIFTLPITSINQSFKLSDSKQILHNTNGQEMIMLRGECLPVFRLHESFGINTERTEISDGIMIQVESSSGSACIFADELLGEYQVVVKPFPSFFNKYNLKGKGLSGCSIMGDGSISLILDVNNLLNNQ